MSSRVRHDLHVAKAALRNKPLRLLGLAVGLVVPYASSVTVVSRCGSIKCVVVSPGLASRGAGSRGEGEGRGSKVGGDGGEVPRRCGSACAAQVFGVTRHRHANMPVGPRPNTAGVPGSKAQVFSSCGYSRSRQGPGQGRAGFGDLVALSRCNLHRNTCLPSLPTQHDWLISILTSPCRLDVHMFTKLPSVWSLS